MIAVSDNGAANEIADAISSSVGQRHDGTPRAGWDSTSSICFPTRVAFGSRENQTTLREHGSPARVGRHRPGRQLPGQRRHPQLYGPQRRPQQAGPPSSGLTRARPQERLVRRRCQRRRHRHRRPRASALDDRRVYRKRPGRRASSRSWLRSRDGLPQRRLEQIAAAEQAQYSRTEHGIGRCGTRSLRERRVSLTPLHHARSAKVLRRQQMRRPGLRHEPLLGRPAARGHSRRGASGFGVDALARFEG